MEGKRIKIAKDKGGNGYIPIDGAIRRRHPAFVSFLLFPLTVPLLRILWYPRDACT